MECHSLTLENSIFLIEKTYIYIYNIHAASIVVSDHFVRSYISKMRFEFKSRTDNNSNLHVEKTVYDYKHEYYLLIYGQTKRG